MISNNKKIAKVSFFLFLFFSFLALGFTFNGSVSAYTSADMPAGYRPLSSEDNGKVFGVDLEPVIYFDTSVIGALGNVHNLYFTDDYFPRIQTYSGTDKEIVYRISDSNSVTLRRSTGTWAVETYSIPDNYFIRFSEGDEEFFYFIYVKDIEPVPTLIESILSLFNKFVIWIPSALTGLIFLFYSSETGLTFLGALAVAGLSISVILLLISIIENFLRFGG